MMAGLEAADAATLTLIERRWDWRTRIVGSVMLIIGLFPIIGHVTIRPFTGSNAHILWVIPAFCLFWYFINMHPLLPYRIGWDRDHIYMRDTGWRRRPFMAMRMADVEEITTGYVDNAAAKAHFFPFDFIDLHSQAQPRPIRIAPSLLYQVQLKDLLRDLYSVKPDIFPEDVIDYMNSTRDL